MVREKLWIVTTGILMVLVILMLVGRFLIPMPDYAIRIIGISMLLVAPVHGYVMVKKYRNKAGRR